MQTKAYKILKILQSKNIQVMYHEQTNTISFNTGGLTEPEINEIWSVKDDIVKLLKDDPDQFRPDSMSSGPGTQLKKLLAKFGIHSKANCSCNKRAHAMDHNGNDWVENNVETVVGWLQEEANKRGLPFLKTAGRILIKKAVANSRKAQKEEAEREREISAKQTAAWKKQLEEKS
tara:strand:+ start:20816 stop:21340 length:525 start_codon:yes stop_codon:yes gene_type:complete